MFVTRDVSFQWEFLDQTFFLAVGHHATAKKNVWSKSFQQNLTSRVTKIISVRVCISILQTSTVLTRISPELSEHYSSNGDFELHCPNPRNETMVSFLLVQSSSKWSEITLLMYFHHNNQFGTVCNTKNQPSKDLISECGTPYLVIRRHHKTTSTQLYTPLHAQLKTRREW